MKTLAAKLALLAVFLSIPAFSGCASPAKAHYEADRKFLDGAGKEWLRYVDADPNLPAESKAARHADWDLFDVEVRHAMEEK